MYFQSFLLCITKLFSFSDIELLEDSGIPTEAFLASCYAVVPVLGKIAGFALNSQSLESVSLQLFCSRNMLNYVYSEMTLLIYLFISLATYS